MVARRWFVVTLLLATVLAIFEACSSDGGGVIPPADSGSGIPEVSTSGDAWGATPCAACVRSSTCIGETTRCRAEPTCARYLDCMEGCPVSDRGALDVECAAACPPPTGSAATKALEDFDQCRTNGAGLSCKGCGVDTTPFTHPVLTQICNDPNYDAGPDATPVQEACTKCGFALCCESRRRCRENPECSALRQCTRDCTDGGTCIDGCVAAHEGAVGMWSEELYCHVIRCPGPCEVPLDSCSDCLYTTCANETIDCQADNDCNLLSTCYGRCTDDACRDACAKGHAGGQERLARLLLCTLQNCFACH